MRSTCRNRAGLERRNRRRSPAPLLLGAVLSLALAGCASLNAPPQFDLRAAPARARPSGATFAVTTPTVFEPYNSDLIVVRGADGALSRAPGARWADRLPTLLQGRIVQTFENAGLARQVVPQGEPAQYALSVDVRRFDIDAAKRQAVVEVTARLVAESGGRVVAAHVFSGAAPVAEIAGVAPAQALGDAFADVLSRLIPWAASLGRYPGT